MGVLAAPLAQLDSITLPLVIVPALAAALFARFTSFGIACIAGLAIGVAQSLMLLPVDAVVVPEGQGQAAARHAGALRRSSIIVIAMFLRGASLPTRGELVEKRLPAAPRPERFATPERALRRARRVALIVLPFDFRQALTNSLIGTVVCLSLVVITGISRPGIARPGGAGRRVAGFAVSRLIVKAGDRLPVRAAGRARSPRPCSACSSARPALRVRGVSLAVVTLAGAWRSSSSCSPTPPGAAGARALRSSSRAGRR